MIRYCPHCQETYLVSNTTSDFVHVCNSGDNSLDQEDVLITGNWEDYSGSGTTLPSQVMMQGKENALQGERAGNLGEREHEYSDRGKIKSMYRQRPHEQFIEFKSAVSKTKEE